MKREERLRTIQYYMELFGPLPDDYEQFAEQSVFKLDNIIIYNQKENKAYCTGCKQTTTNLKLFKNPIQHNKTAICPCCGRVSVAKSNGYIKNGFAVIRWSMIVEKCDEDVLIRYVKHLRKYRSDGSYVQTTTELLRTVITSTRIRDFGNYYDGWAFYRNSMSYFGRGENYEPQSDVMLYNTDIDKTLNGTICQYCAASLMVKHNESHKQEDTLFVDSHIRQQNPYKVGTYLWKYVNYPYCEQLIKLGFFELLGCVDGNTYSEFKFIPGKKRIHETLGLSRCEYLQLRTISNPSAQDVKNLLRLREKGLRVTDDTFFELHLDRGEKLTVNNLSIAMMYMSEQKAVKMCKMYGTRYTDYLDMASRLDWDMKSTMVLFPKDFNQAHQTAVDQFNKQKQNRLKADLRHIFNSHFYDYEDDEFIIAVPKTGAQIVKEGQTLHHCVARYVDDVAKGKTMILFVRRKSNPRKPFYTLEWRENKVKQCYGYKDCKATDEVNKFIRSFEESMIRKTNLIEKGA